MTLAWVAGCGNEEVPVATQDPALVGTWTLGVPSGAFVTTFAADGTCTQVERDLSVTAGTWHTLGETLVLEMAARPVREQVYRMQGEQLFVAVGQPVGEVDGLVGTWRIATAFFGNVLSDELTLRADGSARLVVTGPEPSDGEGTFEVASDVPRLTVTTLRPDGGRRETFFNMVDGRPAGAFLHRLP